MVVHQHVDASANAYYQLPSIYIGRSADRPLQATKEKTSMSWHELIQDGFELYICVILTLEYFLGRSDTDIKNEAKRKKKAREKYHFEALNVGEGK